MKEKEQISPEERRRLKKLEDALWWLQIVTLLLCFLGVLFVAALPVGWWLFGGAIGLAIVFVIVRWKCWRCPKCGEPLPWLWCAAGVLRRQKRDFCPSCGVRIGLDNK